MESENQKLREFLSNSQNHNQKLLSMLKQIKSEKEDLEIKLEQANSKIVQLDLDIVNSQQIIKQLQNENYILKELSKNKEVEIEGLKKKVESLMAFSPSRKKNLINKKSKINLDLKPVQMNSLYNKSLSDQRKLKHQDKITSEERFSEIDSAESINSDEIQEKNMTNQTSEKDQSPQKVFMKRSVTFKQIEKATQKLQKSQIYEQMDQLYFFEEFYIVSQNKNQISEVLYSYPKENTIGLQELKHQIPDFAFPCQIKTEHIQADQNFHSDLEKILNQSINWLQNGSIFVLSPTKLSGHKFNNKFIVHQNSNQFLYGITIQATDFIADKQGITLNQKKQSTQTFSYVQTEVVYVFLTYFPFIEFFSNSIINLIKNINLQRLNQIKQISMDLRSIDLFYFLQILPQIEKYLQYLKSVPTPYPVPKALQFYDGQIAKIYSINVTIDIQLYEQVENFDLGFLKGWTSSQWVVVLSNILMENKILILGKNKLAMSLIILLLIQSIKPLDYMHPILLQLPQNLLPLIEAPVPVILGVVGFKDLIVDGVVIHYEPQQIKIHNSEQLDSQILRNLEFSLRGLFQQIQQKQNQSYQQLLMNILSKSQEMIKSEILNFIPDVPIYKKSSQQLDLNAIRVVLQEKRKTQQDIFIDRLFETQLFQVYIEEYYRKKKN